MARKPINPTCSNGNRIDMKGYPLRCEYLISYDVENNKIRTQIFRELGKYGLKPVQKSVFWGYLTRAELESIKRHLNANLKKMDRAFITHTNFNGRGQSYFVGHSEEDFRDWEETAVI